MPIARWKALSKQEAQGIWDTMEDADKAVILALQENRKAAFKSDHPNSDYSKFSVNTHLTQDTPVDKVDDVLIAMVTKHTNQEKPNSHAADVRAVLSQPVKETKVQIKDNTLTINGHKYVHACDMSNLTIRTILEFQKSSIAIDIPCRNHSVQVLESAYGCVFPS